MVNQKKVQVVKEMVELANKYPVIAVVDFLDLPAPQLQKIREQLRGKVVLRMTKKRLIKRVFKEAKKEELLETIPHMPALLFSEENPFALFKVIEKNKSPAPAKPNQIAPNDVIVKAGPTPFAPGPIIGELGSIGIKSAIEGGKVAIKEDKVVVKEGEAISPKVAELLKRLDIQPMEIGLNLVAVLERGTLYDKKTLHIDEDEYLRNIQQAFSDSLALSMEIGYPTKDNIELLITKCAQNAKALAISESIVTSDTASEIISKVEAQAQSLKNILGG